MSSRTSPQRSGPGGARSAVLRDPSAEDPVALVVRILLEQSLHLGATRGLQHLEDDGQPALLLQARLVEVVRLGLVEVDVRGLRVLRQLQLLRAGDLAGG